MLRILSGTFRNFLTIGQLEQSLDLAIDGLTLVLGENLDVGGGNSRNGAGKAQPLSSLVKTPNGWTTMAAITEGDIVSTPDGNTARVTGTYPQGDKDIYRLHFADGRCVECCEDHLWKVWVRKGEWGWHTMSLRDIVRHRERVSPSSGRVYVPLIEDCPERDANLPIDPRLLGILIGDGNLSASLAVSTSDQEIVDYVALSLPVEYSLKKVGQYDYRISRSDEPYTGDYERRRHVCTHVLGAPLQELGLRKLKSHEKFIPEAYKTASRKQRIELLQGLLDTDGYVCPNGTVTFTTTSKRLAEDVRELVQSIGGIAKLRNKHTSYVYNDIKRDGKPAYDVGIRYRTPRDLVSLERKRARLSESYQYADTLRLELSSIEYAGKKPAKCIRIDHPEQLYITDGHVVTHNTTILQAISYGLYGKPLTKVRLDNLCNAVNGKGMLVTLDFEAHGKRYRVERGRKPAVLRFYREGEQQQAYDEAQGESRHTQAEIDRILGMSHTLFRHIVALNTSTTPFLREEAAMQREVIEELFGIDQLSQRAEALKARMDVTKEQVRRSEAKVSAETEANARITAAIERAKSDAEAWRVTQRHRLNELVNAAQALDAIDIDQEIAVFDAMDRWEQRQREIDGQRQQVERQLTYLAQETERLKRDIARYEATAQHSETGEIERLALQAQSYRTEAEQDIQPQLDRLRSEVVRQRQHAADASDTLERVVAELAVVERQLAHPDEHTCATCGQSLAGTDHLETVVANLIRQRDHLTAKHDQLTTDRAAMLRHAEAVADEIGEREQADHQRRAVLLSKAVVLDGQIAQAKTERQVQRERVAAEIAELRARLDTAEVHKGQQTVQLTLLPKVEPRPVSRYADRQAVWQVRQERDRLISQIEAERSKPNPHQVKIDGLQATLVEIDYTSLNELILQQKHESFLHRLLTAKDSFVRKRIVDQNLSFLNKRLDHYLQRLGLPHEVVFQPDLSVEIDLLGRSYDFEQLSRGEMNRVILATSWAFRDVYESLNTTFNLLFVDEMLDQGTDGAGVEAALDILAGMAAERHRSVFLISHRDELRDRIDHVLTVRKENQFTVFT